MVIVMKKKRRTTRTHTPDTRQMNAAVPSDRARGALQWGNTRKTQHARHKRGVHNEHIKWRGMPGSKKRKDETQHKLRPDGQTTWGKL